MIGTPSPLAHVSARAYILKAMKRLAFALLACAGGLFTASCGSPADVAGDYTISVTNEDNGCNLQNFTEGASSSNIPATIDQANSDVHITVTGLVGDYLDAVLGSNEWDGDISGDSIHATLFGTRSATMNGCSFTFNAEMDANVDGDAITGTIAYTPNTNDSPDCDPIKDCESTQDFNGTRPPQ